VKRIAVLLIISLLAISDTSAAQAKTYQNCYQLTGDFPYGVAQGYYRVGTSNASIDRKTYTSNKKLDTDYDGIVCEVENLQNPPTTTTTTTTIPITLKTPVADLSAFVKSQGNALTTIKCKSNSSVSTGSGTSIQMTYTGSAAGDKGIRSTLVTNHHVVANCLSGDWLSRQVQVQTGSTECVGYVWSYSSAKDLASVHTICDIPKVSAFTGTLVPKPVIGDVGIIIGSAAGVAGTSTQGAIANITDNEIFTTAQAAPGSSGGALFNRSGQLLGIVQSGTGSLTIVIPITKFTDAIYNASTSIAWQN
jgi:S1-C subfamily serine protease